jgi:hypothetical protein
MCSRTLPKNKSAKQKLIINVVWDYFGIGEKTRANQICLFVMGRKRGVHLTEEEMCDVRCIKINMQDELYLSSFEAK